MVAVEQYMMLYQLQPSHQSIIICLTQKLWLSLSLVTAQIILVEQVLPHRCVEPHLWLFQKQAVITQQAVGLQLQLVQAIQYLLFKQLMQTMLALERSI